MITYKIKQTSLVYWFISSFSTLIVGEGITIALALNGVIPKGQIWLIFLLVAAAFYLAFKVPRYTATVDIELIMDQDGLRKKWLKQFIFTNSPDIAIKWVDVRDYVF